MRYFIAYALGDGERDAVQALRDDLASRFGAKSALHLPPHVTLFASFEHPDATALVPALAAAAAASYPVPLATPRFAAFGEVTWFLDVVREPALVAVKRRIQAAVRATLGLEEPTPYHDLHFHVTLASKDVTPDRFRRIGAYLRTRRPPCERIIADSLTLYAHRGGEWREVRTFAFSGH